MRYPFSFMAMNVGQGPGDESRNNQQKRRSKEEY